MLLDNYSSMKSATRVTKNVARIDRFTQGYGRSCVTGSRQLIQQRNAVQGPSRRQVCRIFTTIIIRLICETTSSMQSSQCVERCGELYRGTASEVERMQWMSLFACTIHTAECFKASIHRSSERPGSDVRNSCRVEKRRRRQALTRFQSICIERGHAR